MTAVNRPSAVPALTHFHEWQEELQAWPLSAGKATRGEHVSDETRARIKASAIRFLWTWVFAFVSQPVILAVVARIEDGSWDWSVAWAQVAIAALAAAIYALKKYRWPETTW